MGQLLRLDFLWISFPVIDLIIPLVFFTFKSKKPVNKPFIFFLIFAWASLLINHLFFRPTTIHSWFYLVRLSFLLGLIIYPPRISHRFHKLTLLAIVANIIFGLIQYTLWPDFTYFRSLGWDDHLNRLVSTYFDPTFTALIYLMFFIYLYFNFPKYSLFILIPIFLTYSRSTFLSLSVCLFFIALKTRKIFYPFLLFCLLLISILLLPRSAGEGTKLERTSSINAKIIDYQEAITTFTKSPIIGHGYNNLSSVRDTKNFTRSSFDSSLLTILTTTGLVGFVLFVFGLIKLFNQSNPMKQTMLVAILVHSLFANSLLYPWILILLVLL